MVGPTINLISGTHHLCERREYAFMVLREYRIISLGWEGKGQRIVVWLSCFLFGPTKTQSSQNREKIEVKIGCKILT